MYNTQYTYPPTDTPHTAYTDRHTVGETQTDRPTDRLADLQSDRETDQQTDRHASRKTGREPKPTPDGPITLNYLTYNLIALQWL